jgi:hypothetical protein
MFRVPFSAQQVRVQPEYGVNACIPCGRPPVLWLPQVKRLVKTQVHPIGSPFARARQQYAQFLWQRRDIVNRAQQSTSCVIIV